MLLLSLAIHIKSEREVAGWSKWRVLGRFQQQLDLLVLPKSDITHLLVHLFFLISVQSIEVYGK